MDGEIKKSNESLLHEEIRCHEINEDAEIIYAHNVEKGFYDHAEFNVGEKLMLMVSELGEALEAHRKGRFANLKKLDGVILDSLDNEEFKWRFQQNIKDTYEDELADVYIRLLDHAGSLGIDFESHIKLKNRYNSLREYKHGKKY